MFLRLLLVEESKLLKRWLLWILIAIMVGMVFLSIVVPFVLVYREARAVQGPLPPEILDNLRENLPVKAIERAMRMNQLGFGGVLLMIFTGTVVAQEYSWRSLHLWLSRGLSRGTVYLAKAVALLGPIMLMALVPVIFGGLFSLGMSQVMKDLIGDMSVPTVNMANLLMSILREVFTLSYCVTLAYFLTIWSRSQVMAVAGSVLIELMVDSLGYSVLSSINTGIRKLGGYIPQGLWRSIHLVSRVGTELPEIPHAEGILLETNTAALLLLSYTVVLLLGAALIFRRQELSG